MERQSAHEPDKSGMVALLEGENAILREHSDFYRHQIEVKDTQPSRSATIEKTETSRGSEASDVVAIGRFATSPDLASVRPMPIKPPASSYVWGHGRPSTASVWTTRSRLPAGAPEIR